MAEYDDDDDENKKKSIGALWKYTSKSGLKYMSGTIEIDGESHRFVVYNNKYKKQSKHPDFLIYKHKEPDREGHYQSRAKQEQNNQQEDDCGTDEVPF